MACWLLALVMTGPLGQQAEKMPPLSEEQRQRLQQLVQQTRQKAARINSALKQKQKELTQCYEEFNLDVDAVEKLQSEIIELQRRLLANYHDMQVELRTIVGQERFQVLRQRLARVLGVDGPNEEKQR